MNSKLEGKLLHFELKVSKEMRTKFSAGNEIPLYEGYYVDAQMKHSQQWFRARILDCRLSKGTKCFQKFVLKFLLFAFNPNYRL
jgi:hypothetical protein